MHSDGGGEKRPHSGCISMVEWIGSVAVEGEREDDSNACASAAGGMELPQTEMQKTIADLERKCLFFSDKFEVPVRHLSRYVE